MDCVPSSYLWASIRAPQGFTVPGCTCVCGDSHTATHGAFGALAFGIGTSEVEHVLATSTLTQKKARNMLVQVEALRGLTTILRVADVRSSSCDGY